MLRDWFDERFRAAGGRIFFFSPVRLAMAVVIWAVLGLATSWAPAGVWFAAAVLVEWPLREMTRPMARGLTLSHAETLFCIAVYAIGIGIWSTAGAVLWSSSHVACQIAGAAFFAGQLIYVERHHGRSMGALLPALPALAAPAVAPLAVVHYHGVDQMVIEATMLALVAQATISIVVSVRDGRRRAEPESVQQNLKTEAVWALPAAPVAAERSPDISNRPLRVLVAEDNSVNQLVLKMLLGQAGVQPESVADGQAALDAWTREPWDLILMDVQMPVMDGPTATRAIRAAEARSGRVRTPIVALTGHAMAHQVAAYAEAGMDAHVAKPIEAAALFEALRIVDAPMGQALGERSAAAA